MGTTDLVKKEIVKVLGKRSGLNSNQLKDFIVPRVCSLRTFYKVLNKMYEVERIEHSRYDVEYRLRKIIKSEDLWIKYFQKLLQEHDTKVEEVKRSFSSLESFQAKTIMGLSESLHNIKNSVILTRHQSKFMSSKKFEDLISTIEKKEHDTLLDFFRISNKKENSKLAEDFIQLNYENQVRVGESIYYTIHRPE